ncbi:unnamed protein product [Lota lota]
MRRMQKCEDQLSVSNAEPRVNLNNCCGCGIKEKRRSAERCSAHSITKDPTAEDGKAQARTTMRDTYCVCSANTVRMHDD